MISRTSSNGVANDQERIAQRAHEIWKEAGCPEGQSLAHWLQAEAELSQNVGASQREAAPRSRSSRRRTAQEPASLVGK